MLVIPSGMKVIIKDPEDKFIYTGILAEDFNFSLSSTFSPLVGSGNSKVLTMLGGATKSFTGGKAGFSGQFKQMGFQIWESTAPVVIQFTVDIHMKTNARVDVLDKVKALVKIPLPGTGTAGNLIPPGPSIVEALTGTEAPNTPPTASEEADPNSADSYVNIIIGGLILMGCIMESAEPAFSRFPDESGAPIGATVQIRASTMYTATKNDVDKW